MLGITTGLRAPRAALGLATMALGLLAVLTAMAVTRVASPARSAPTGRAAASGLGRLESLPLAAQAAISGTLGSESGSFAARRSASGWQLSGGGVHARFRGAGPDLQATGGGLSMTLAGVGRGGASSPVPLASVSAHGNRVTLHHGGIDEWYAAGPLGIEQGFTVARRPGGQAGPLMLALGLNGSLRPQASASGIRFVSPAGRTALRYGALQALDASGRLLSSSLRVRDGRLMIAVQDRGARYPIRIDPLVQQGPKLTANDEAGNGVGSEFGFSVALSGDGNTALIGGPVDNSDVGAAWVFTRSGSTWSQQGHKLVPTGLTTNSADFGASVALSADGSTALIGGTLDGGERGVGQDGAAWVFTRSGSTWTQQGPKLVADCTGTCVGPSGTGEVGSGEFGSSVALSSNGDTALIGAPADGNAVGGAAWVFTRTAANWSQQMEIVPGTSPVGTGPVGTNINFGDAVSLSADGNIALIGAKQDNTPTGAAWVFTRSGPQWIQRAKLTPNDATNFTVAFGVAVDLSADGTTALIGGNQDDNAIGAAWVFTGSGSTWSQQGPKLTGGGVSGSIPEFGNSVALSGNGSTALIGASQDANNIGSAFLFTRSGTTWSQQGSKLTGQGEVNNGFFGAGVALSNDGQTALVGGPSDLSETGAAWAFAPPAPVCSSVAASTPVGGGGVAVSLSCTAPAGATLNFGIVGGPAHGTLTGLNAATGKLTYASQSGFAGQDSFTYHVSDQWGLSNTATATITVPALPVPTCANVKTRAAKGAKRVTLSLKCIGPAGHPFSYVIVSPPANGKLGAINQDNGRVTYTVRTGFSGSDRFIYEGVDAGGASQAAAATIIIPRLPHITSTMGWSFSPTLSTSTVVRQMSVNSVPGPASVTLACATKGCPIKAHTQRLPKRRVCTGKGRKRKCRTTVPKTGTIDLTRLVAGKRVQVGARIMVSIVQPGTVGKQYIFKIRAGRQPAVTILALAPGTTKPCPGC